MSQSHILVTGGTGQVGIELARLNWPDDSVLHCPTHDELDLASSQSITDYIARQPCDVVINCAAWTAVDAAEDNVGAAFQANSQGPAWLAEAAARGGAAFIQVSTDYVFSGTLDRAYCETDAVGPVGAYGASKLAGELAVRAATPRAVLFRTAWIVSPHRTNFLKTMLRLGAERDRLAVVGDQQGCPTSAADIAAALQVIALRQIRDLTAPTGTFHFANAGAASWHELAEAIFEMAAPFGGPTPEVVAIPTAAYPTRAVRPANSRLETSKIRRTFGIVPRPWRVAVGEIIEDLMSAAATEKDMA